MKFFFNKVNIYPRKKLIFLLQEMFDRHLWIFWRILNKCMKCQMNSFEDTDVNKRMLQRYYTGSFKMNVKSNCFMTETYLTLKGYGWCNLLASM